MAKDKCVDGMAIVAHGKEGLNCGDCQEGKGHCAAHPDSNRERAKLAPERLHADLVGPINLKSLGRASYFLLLKDEYSGYMFVKFLRSKTEVLERIKSAVEEVTLATHSRVRCLRTDNGSEFRNEATQFYLGSEGIVHELSAPHTQQQNDN